MKESKVATSRYVSHRPSSCNDDGHW